MVARVCATHVCTVKAEPGVNIISLHPDHKRTMGILSFLLMKKSKKIRKDAPDSEPITLRAPEIEPEPVTSRMTSADSERLVHQSVCLEDPYSKPIE